MSDDYKVELNLTHKEYGRAELVTHIGIAYGFFGVESTDQVIKRIFLSGLIGAEYAVLGGSDHGSSGTVQAAILGFLEKDLPNPSAELVATYLLERFKQDPP